MSLQLSSESNDCEWAWLLIITNSFLGGIAPHLQSLNLRDIPFLTPQKLLLSATDLVTLHREHIPSTRYILPKELVTCLSMLTKLEELAFGFQASRCGPFYLDQTSQHLPLVPSTVLPALTSFQFWGDCWYLEDFITQISLPLLHNLNIMYFNLGWQIVDSPPLCKFVNCIETLEMHHCADISFHQDFVNIMLSQQEGLANCRKIKFGILCSTLGLQLSHLRWLGNLSLLSLPTLEHFYIYDHDSFPLDCRQFSTEGH